MSSTESTDRPHCVGYFEEDFLYGPGPTGEVVDMSDSKSNFMLHIGLNESAPQNRAIFRAIMDEARAGRERLFSSRECLIDAVKDDLSIQAPYDPKHISEEAFSKELKYIYDHASSQTRGIYEMLWTPFPIPGFDLWPIRWTLARALVGTSDEEDDEGVDTYSRSSPTRGCHSKFHERPSYPMTPGSGMPSPTTSELVMDLPSPGQCLPTPPASLKSHRSSHSTSSERSCTPQTTSARLSRSLTPGVLAKKGLPADITAGSAQARSLSRSRVGPVDHRDSYRSEAPMVSHKTGTAEAPIQPHTDRPAQRGTCDISVQPRVDSNLKRKRDTGEQESQRFRPAAVQQAMSPAARRAATSPRGDYWAHVLNS